MFDDPFKKFFKRNVARCNFKYYIGKFLLRIFQLYLVERQKNKHDVCADTLVAVHKCVVLYKTIAKSCGFLL